MITSLSKKEAQQILQLFKTANPLGITNDDMADRMMIEDNANVVVPSPTPAAPIPQPRATPVPQPLPLGMTNADMADKMMIEDNVNVPQPAVSPLKPAPVSPVQAPKPTNPLPMGLGAKQGELPPQVAVVPKKIDALAANTVNRVKNERAQALSAAGLDPKAPPAQFSGMVPPARDKGIMGVLNSPSSEVNKQIAASPEYAAAEKATKKLDGIRTGLQQQIAQRKPAATPTPQPAAQVPSKPTTKPNLVSGPGVAGMGGVSMINTLKDRGLIPKNFSLTPSQRVGESPLPPAVAKGRAEVLNKINPGVAAAAPAATPQPAPQSAPAPVPAAKPAPAPVASAPVPAPVPAAKPAPVPVASAPTPTPQEKSPAPLQVGGPENGITIGNPLAGGVSLAPTPQAPVTLPSPEGSIAVGNPTGAPEPVMPTPPAPTPAATALSGDPTEQEMQLLQKLHNSKFNSASRRDQEMLRHLRAAGQEAGGYGDFKTLRNLAYAQQYGANSDYGRLAQKWRDSAGTGSIPKMAQYTGLTRRNTGVTTLEGNIWVNPADQEWLNKSAAYAELSWEDYKNLDPAETPENIQTFFSK
jgi:hypothetical protein